MEPLAMFGLGVPELLIILAVVLLLFGGSRLAGLGKSSGRALIEVKEETRSLKPEGQPTRARRPTTTSVRPTRPLTRPTPTPATSAKTSEPSRVLPCLCPSRGGRSTSA